MAFKVVKAKIILYDMINSTHFYSVLSMTGRHDSQQEINVAAAMDISAIHLKCTFHLMLNRCHIIYHWYILSDMTHPHLFFKPP